MFASWFAGSCDPGRRHQALPRTRAQSGDTASVRSAPASRDQPGEQNVNKLIRDFKEFIIMTSKVPTMKETLHYLKTRDQGIFSVLR